MNPNAEIATSMDLKWIGSYNLNCEQKTAIKNGYTWNESLTFSDTQKIN